MKLRPVIGVALLLGIGAMTGCTPGADGMVGLERQSDGSLSVLIRMCHGTVDQLVLRAINAYPSGQDGEERSNTWRTVPDDESPLPTEHTVRDDVAMPFDESDLHPDVLYELIASDSDSWAIGGYFGAEELAGLEPSEVLAYPRRGADGVHEIMSKSDFESSVKEFCG
jgi:hypothetical protein